MRSPLKFLTLLAIALPAPSVALAQAWPATVISSVRTLGPDGRAVAAAPRKAPTPRHTAIAPLDWDAAPRQALVLSPTAEERLAEADDIEIKPKAEWYDDQGLRVSPTRMAYKQRF